MSTITSVQSKKTSIKESVKLTKPQLKKEAPLFKFNGEIEIASQGEKAIDCWLLSGINALKTTSWGRKAIKDAIKADGMGGAYITFKNSPIEQKTFHITVEDMVAASKQEKYSSGDPDMTAIELAVEKLYKIMDSRKMGELIAPDEMDPYLGTMMKPDGCDCYHIEELLSDSKIVLLEKYDEISESDYSKIFSFISKNKDDYALTCIFNDEVCEKINVKNVYGYHVYSVNKIVEGKYVIITNPYMPQKEIKLTWEQFSKVFQYATVSAKNDDAKKYLEANFPHKYKKLYDNQMQKNFKLRQKEKKCEAIYNDFESEQKIEKNVKTLYSKLEKKINNGSYDAIYDEINNLTDSEKYHLMKKYSGEIIKSLNAKISGWGSTKKKTAILKLFVDAVFNNLDKWAKHSDSDVTIVYLRKKKCMEELNAFLSPNYDEIKYQINKTISTVERLINKAKASADEFIKS